MITIANTQVPPNPEGEAPAAGRLVLRRQGTLPDRPTHSARASGVLSAQVAGMAEKRRDRDRPESCSTTPVFETDTKGEDILQKVFATLVGFVAAAAALLPTVVEAAAALLPTIVEAGVRLPNHNETLVQGK
jgi:hypothetical protein